MNLASEQYGIEVNELWRMQHSHKDFQVMLKGFESETAGLKEDSKMKPLLTAIGSAYSMQEFGTPYKIQAPAPAAYLSPCRPSKWAFSGGSA
jgi:hypothetical protein